MEEKCNFVAAWVGICNAPSPCEKHKNIKCKKCGEAATHTCSYPGFMVCGAPLCGRCKCKHLGDTNARHTKKQASTS